MFSSHNAFNNSTDWVQLRNNDQVDIDDMGRNAFASGWRQYQLSMWWGYPVYVLVFWFGAAAVLPFLAGRITREALEAERARLNRTIENNEALLSEHERREGHQPYR